MIGVLWATSNQAADLLFTNIVDRLRGFPRIFDLEHENSKFESIFMLKRAIQNISKIVYLLKVIKG